MSEIHLLSDSDHLALRALREKLVMAFNRQDLEGMLALVDESATFTAPNGHTLYGHDSLRQFYQHMIGGPQARFRQASITKAEADRYSTIYGGQYAIGSGWADTSVQTRDGRRHLSGIRWTQTLLKIDGQWRIIALHCSPKGSDNSTVNSAGEATPVQILAAVVVAIGFLAGLIVPRR